jgi:hypothetical protein
MAISMYRASTPAFVQTLSALAKIIDKAAAHCAAKKIDPTTLLNTRLYPDMFPLVRQVQIACDFAKNTAARLAGVEAPSIPDEEKTLEELKSRIAKTIDFVNSVPPSQIDGSEEKDITFPVGGKPMTLKGEPYLVNFALPNFYFHATTAYDILRHCGLEIGKRDFLNRT